MKPLGFLKDFLICISRYMPLAWLNHEGHDVLGLEQA